MPDRRDECPHNVITARILAWEDGVPQRTISRLEANQSDSISLSNLEKLAKALGCEPGFLIVKKGR